MLKMNAILGLFIFLLSVIPYCKAAENIIIKQEKLQNYSYNQINEKIIETDLVICNDDNESILTNFCLGCQCFSEFICREVSNVEFASEYVPIITRL